LLALGYRSFTLIGHDEVQDDVEDRRIARIKHPAATLETGGDDDRDDGGDNGGDNGGDDVREEAR
ncbi:MAG: sodium:proton antiporter, partial [Pseudonocardia sp.]